MVGGIVMKMWIAINKMGHLGLFTDKPKYEEEYDTWMILCGLPLYISEHYFPEVTFENSPQEVELTIKK